MTALSLPTPPHSAHARQHSHNFDDGNPHAERRVRLAMWITLGTMVLEIVCGWWFNSMALLADGWHMSSHALALGLSVTAWATARRLAGDTRFAFGTWKIEVLASYTSAILLFLVAAFMVVESLTRLLAPSPIQHAQAMGIATLGLVVNLACAWLLQGGHAHHHHDDGPHSHAHTHHDDINLRSAYMHVLADAATSVLAIVALAGGMLWGWDWLDPVMGLAGAALMAHWAVGLVRESARVLLDAEMDAPVAATVRHKIAQGPLPASITDLHVWRVGKGTYACIVAVEGGSAVTPDYIRSLLCEHGCQYGCRHGELVHVSVEVNAP